MRPDSKAAEPSDTHRCDRAPTVRRSLCLYTLPLAGRASVPVATETFASQAAYGSAAPLNPTGATTCSILFTNAGGSAITVEGATNTNRTTYSINTSFGTHGEIEHPRDSSVWTGDVSQYPAGFRFSWAHNAGTISGSVTCFGKAEPTPGSARKPLDAIAAADPPTFFPLATSTPFLVTNSGTPSITVAPWAFQATSSSCGPSDSNLIMQWEDNTVPTGSAGNAYLSCNGNFTITGAYTGSGSGLTGIPYSALPYAPVPLATSTPLLITNSESQAVSATPPYIFQSTSAACDDNSSAIIAQFANSSAPHIVAPLTIFCSSVGSNLNSGINVVGDVHASAYVYGLGGYIAPTFTTSGSAAPSTSHCVSGNATATGSSVTISLTGAAVFATAPAEVAGVNVTTGMAIPTTAFSSIGTSSVTFSATSGDSYYFYFCGF